MLVKLSKGRDRSDEQDDSADHRLKPVHPGYDKPHHASDQRHHQQDHGQRRHTNE